MKILVDTGTWLKLDLLFKNRLFDFQILYDSTEVYITHQVETELYHFKPATWLKERTRIIPIGNKNLYEEARVNFGDADASVLSHGVPISSEKGGYIIVSEDRPLLSYAKIYCFYVIQLIDLFKILTSTSILSKNTLYQLNRDLLTLKNISKKKGKEINNWLQNFQ